MSKLTFEGVSIPQSMGGQMKLPEELEFIGDKKPYKLYGKEYKTKTLSKKTGEDGAKEAFTKIRQTIPEEANTHLSKIIKN